jgi:hypothetical protein
MSGCAIVVIILFSDLVFLPLFLNQDGLSLWEMGIFVTNRHETVPISVKREEALQATACKSEHYSFI